MNRPLIIIVLILFITGIAGVAAAEETIKVAVTPFTINAAENMAYLKSGIQDMLESRLSQGEQIFVIPDEETAKAMAGIKDPLDENKAREIGGRLNASFVLIGSMTVFGSSVSLDVRLVDTTAQKSTLAFFEQSENIDDLVSKVNRVALDINAHLLGPAAGAGAATGVSDTKSEPEDDVHIHPEKIAEEVPVSENEAAAGSVAATADKGPVDFWKSRTYKFNIHGMALGDVYGTGKIETVVVTQNTLIVFKNENRQFFKIDDIKEGRNERFIAVDVADINDNGYAEIFVSGLTPQRTGVSSSIYEYNGKTFVKTSEKRPWLYRVFHISEKKAGLLGQKFRPKRNQVAPIFRMAWIDGDYNPEKEILSSSDFVLLGVAYGKLTTDNTKSIIAYNNDDRIQIVDQFGDTQYNAKTPYGGNTLHYSKGRLDKGETDQTFLPMRILLHDIDNDGGNDVLAVKNFDMMNRVFDNTRIFTDSQIESFSWDGLDLTSKWKTPKISGRGIRDIAVGDFDNDGLIELVAAVILNDGSVLGTTPKSRLIAFELDRTTPMSE